MSRIQPTPLRTTGIAPVYSPPLPFSTPQKTTSDLLFIGQNQTLKADNHTYQLKGCSMDEAKKALPKLLTSQSFAKANANSNLKTPDNKRFFGAVLEFEDGQKFMSGNYILFRETPRCDIDNAITLGLHQWREQNWKSSTPLQSPKVKALYLSNADPSNAANPCEDCLSHLNTSIFSPDTKIYTLEGNLETPNGIIRKQTIADLLPLHQGRTTPTSWLTQQSVKELPIVTSPSAQYVLTTSNAPSSSKIRHLLNQAKKAYERSEKTDANTQTHAGSAVIVSPFSHKIHTGARFEWARRWPELADLSAAQNGIQQIQKRQLPLKYLMEKQWMPSFIKMRLQHWLKSPSVVAVAYYNDMPPSIMSLGRLRRHRGSADTLVITVENETIQVRTMRDYLPIVYDTPLLLKPSK